MGRIFQTMTFEEQTEVLDHLEKAREVLRARPTNEERESCDDHITSAFRHVQLANTQPL